MHAPTCTCIRTRLHHLRPTTHTRVRLRNHASVRQRARPCARAQAHENASAQVSKHEDDTGLNPIATCNWNVHSNEAHLGVHSKSASTSQASMQSLNLLPDRSHGLGLLLPAGQLCFFELTQGPCKGRNFSYTKESPMTDDDLVCSTLLLPPLGSTMCTLSIGLSTNALCFSLSSQHQRARGTDRATSLLRFKAKKAGEEPLAWQCKVHTNKPPHRATQTIRTTTWKRRTPEAMTFACLPTTPCVRNHTTASLLDGIHMFIGQRTELVQSLNIHKSAHGRLHGDAGSHVKPASPCQPWTARTASVLHL